MSAQQEELPVHPIAKRLRSAGIKHIHIIDDAYDPPRLNVDYASSDIGDFWNAVRAATGGREELNATKPIAEASEIDDDVVFDLFRKHRDGKLSVLETAFVSSFMKAKAAQRKDLDALCAHLQALGYQPKPVGALEALPTDAQLVFLDYVLDLSNKMSLDELAKAKAEELYSKAKDGEKPFIVLMSDRPEAAQAHEQFRAKSMLLGGLFGFLSKEEASKSATLFLRLGSWGIGRPVHEELQKFVNSVVSAADTVTNKFKERVRSLGVQDYAFIQRLSLHEEGHPLGDYLLWLFEASLGFQFRDEPSVRAAQDALDRMRFDKFLPCQSPPSERLAGFFLTALTDPAVKDLAPHPHDKDNKVPLLSLGDIFVRGKTDNVLIVISAACDLAFAPGEKRVCDPDQPVLLVPGRLQAIDQREASTSEVRTELILHDDKPYRILWDCTHAETQRLGKIWEFFRAEGYERKWRLRVPYALAIQAEFANRVTRVGMPVAPPIFGQADATLLIKGADGKAISIGDPILGGIVLLHGEKDDQFVVTVDCVSEVTKRLPDAGSAIAATATAVVEGESANAIAARKAVTDRAAKVRAAADNLDLWLGLLESPKAIPATGKRVDIDPKLLSVCRGVQGGEDYPGANVPILINIVVPAASSVTPEVAPLTADTGTAT